MNTSPGQRLAHPAAEMPAEPVPHLPRPTYGTASGIHGVSHRAGSSPAHDAESGAAGAHGERNGHAKQPPATMSFAPGEIIFTANSGSGLVYIVRSGCVRLSKTLTGGRSISLGLLGPHTIFTQEDTSDGIATGIIAEALVPSSLSVIEASDLAALIAESPELTGAVVTGMTRRLTELHTLVEQLLARDTAVRLATMLLTLAARFGRPSDESMIALGLPLTHQTLANMIGSNRVTVTRKLLDFQAEGLARSLGRNRLAVNPAALRSFLECATADG